MACEHHGEQPERFTWEGIAIERLTLDEGAVNLQWPSNLSRDSVAEFQYWAFGIINRARRKAGMLKLVEHPTPNR